MQHKDLLYMRNNFRREEKYENSKRTNQYFSSVFFDHCNTCQFYDFVAFQHDIEQGLYAWISRKKWIL